MDFNRDLRWSKSCAFTHTCMYACACNHGCMHAHVCLCVHLCGCAPQIAKKVKGTKFYWCVLSEFPIH